MGLMAVGMPLEFSAYRQHVFILVLSASYSYITVYLFKPCFLAVVILTLLYGFSLLDKL